MTFDEILVKVLEISQFPEERRQDFVDTFYQYLFMKLVSEVQKEDPENSEKIMRINADKLDSEEVKRIVSKISQNPKLQSQINKVTDEVISEIVDDIAKYATEEQKNKIGSVITS